MTPEERALIDGLFQRMGQVSNQSRDGEAEALIARYVSQMPYAPYALAQTVLVQEHALRQAQARIEELEAQARQDTPAPSGGSFLGGLLGGRGTSVPSMGGRPATASAASLPPQQPQPEMPPAAAPRGPWGQNRSFGGFGGGGGGGGGFLQGAMATAAGVAGGMLLANGIRNLMSGGTGPIAEQAAALADPAKAVTPTDLNTQDLGTQAQDALGGAAPDAPWTPAPQDASYDAGGGWSDDAGWDAGGDDGGDWT